MTKDCNPKLMHFILSALTRREYSASELRLKLQQKGYGASEIAEALAQSQSLGYQSDARFSEQVCRARIAQGYGPLRIQNELAAKGIADDLIEMVLQQESMEDWRERAIAVARKKQARLFDLSWDEREKLKRFLFYRGFTMALISAVFNDATANEF